MKIMGGNLRVGDVMKIAWAGQSKAIVDILPYNGPLEWVGWIVVFVDGSRMSIDLFRHYECISRA